MGSTAKIIPLETERQSVATVRNDKHQWLALCEGFYYWADDFYEAQHYESPGAAMIAAHDHDVGPCVVQVWTMDLRWEEDVLA